jgi:hypothetical protein
MILPSAAYLIAGRRAAAIWSGAVLCVYAGFLWADTPGMPVAPQLFESTDMTLAQNLGVLLLVATCFVLFERPRTGHSRRCGTRTRI